MTTLDEYLEYHTEALLQNFKIKNNSLNIIRKFHYDEEFFFTDMAYGTFVQEFCGETTFYFVDMGDQINVISKEYFNYPFVCYKEGDGPEREDFIEAMNTLGLVRIHYDLSQCARAKELIEEPNSGLRLVKFLPGSLGIENGKFSYKGPEVMYITEDNIHERQEVDDFLYQYDDEINW